jgi:hypothetical protein
MSKQFGVRPLLQKISLTGVYRSPQLSLLRSA